MPIPAPPDLTSGAWPGPGGLVATLGRDPASLDRVHAALAAGGAAAWYSDLQSRERWWSEAMFAIHGLSSVEPVPADYLALVHPEDRDVVAAAFKQSIQTGAHRVEYRVVWPDGSCHWLEGVGRTLHDPVTGALAISGLASAIDARRKQQADLRFLAEASSELARSTDDAKTLRSVAAMAVRHFADWCAVDMLDEGSHELHRVAVAHIDPAKVQLAQELHRRYPPDRQAPVGVWNVVRTGQPEMIAEISPEVLKAGTSDAEHLRIVESLGLRSYIGVPICGPGDRVLGVVTFVSSDSGRVYDARDLELATDLVARVGVAVQNARLVKALQHSQQRQGLLLQLTDILRDSGNIVQVLERVSALLGRHFEVDRVGYGHVDERLDCIEYDVCWTAPGVPTLLGTYPASAFGQPVIDRLRAGETVAIANVRTHPFTSDQATLRTSQEVETRAVLVVPLSKAGRLRTIVYLNQEPERAWLPDEVSLMEEIAERTRELIERGRVENALREGEARWRGLFERMVEGFFTAAAIRDDTGRMVDFRFLEVNPAFERLTGVAVALAIGSPVSVAIPGVPQALIDRYAAVVDTGESAEFEVQIAALGDRWYEARARRIAPDQFSVLFLEITDRKAAQGQALREAERYRTLFESIDEGFCLLEMLFDTEGRPVDYRFVEVNPAFERQSGVIDPVGRTIRQLFPDIDTAYIDIYGRVAKTGQPIRFESHAGPLGRWFDTFAFNVGGPEQPRVALLFTDITERKRVQDALIEREAELREAQRLAGIGSWTWDLLTDRVDITPEVLRVFGLREAKDFPAFEDQQGTLYPAADWNRLNAAVQATVSGGGPYSVDLRAFREGRPIWVTARGTAVQNAAGAVVGLRCMVQDITERKQTEKMLRDADARKNEFLATLAHELRNPLAPIRTGLSVLRRSEDRSDKTERIHAIMERQVAHLVRLVDDLLDVSRVIHGKVVLRPSVQALSDVVDLALETARPSIEAAGHRLTVELPSQPVLVRADATRIAQVLCNVLNNAAKYTQPGGDIGLHAAVSAPGWLVLEVRDNGMGIPADMLEHVFDLFTQVGNPTDRTHGGLGIGLSLAQQLVKLHGGEIRAFSAGPGTGSTFRLELPVVLATVDADSPPASSSAGSRADAHRSVLVVDDNADAAEALGMLLEIEGHAVRIVHTGTQALAALEHWRPDVVFLDIGLPDIDGYEVARRLRERDPALDSVLVALTGWGAAHDQQRAKEAGFDLHLTKPVTMAELQKGLEWTLGVRA